MTDYFTMPNELPEKPTGWTQKMLMHLNCGGHGHMGAFEIFDETGRVMPIGKQYNTKDVTCCGFTLPGVKPCMSWQELRRLWPTWIERARNKQRERMASK